jgi:hypothetical protein
MVGGIIPLRRATSSRYDGRLGQESAVEGVKRIEIHITNLPLFSRAHRCCLF